MAVSVLNPIGRALSRTGAVLFQPFSVGKWLKLGFCAFLMQLGEGCGGGDWIANWSARGPTGPPGPPSAPPGPGRRDFPSGPEIADWISANVLAVAVIAASVVLVIVLLSALLTWLSSRGRFMFIDGIVLNRGAVVEPWRALRRLGNSLFAFTFTLQMIGLLISIGLLLLAGGIAWPDLQRGEWTSHATTAVALLVVGGVLLTVPLALIVFLLHNFVVPTMYLRDERVLAAWAIAKRELFDGHLGHIILYLLMRILLVILTGVMAAAVGCLTCCIGFLPYIGTVLTLPLWVFLQCYALCFIEGFGPQWRFFFQPLICPECGYDLRATPIGGSCPECGRVHDPEPLRGSAPAP